MGLIPPPASVFNEWSPEAQQSYNSEIDVFAQDRDAHLAEAREAGNKAAEANQKAAEQQFVMDADKATRAPDSAKYDGTQFRRDVYLGQASYYESVERKEQAKADAAQAKIDERAITPMNSTPVNQPEIKSQYEKELQLQLAADTKKILELRQREAELQAAIDDAYIPFITMRDEKAELEQVRAEILKVAATIAFNKKCELATQGPKEPPAPVMASPAGSPLVQKYVGMGARLQCSFGAALTLSVQRPTTMIETSPMANIMDFKPFVNIIPTGTCSAPTNPAVIAAMGSPVPCTPLIPAPWAPGKPDVLVEKFPALLSTDKCFCAYAGLIQIMP